MNRYAPMLVLLAAIWGASYLFIKVAVDEIAPAPMMAMRTLLAAAVLITYVVWRFGWERTRAEIRTAWRHFLVLGALNAAVPFWLIAWGEQHIDSGLAAVVQASVPIFNALIALKFLPHERLNGTRALGLGDRDRRRRRRHRDPSRAAAGWRSPARSRSSSPRSPTRAPACTASSRSPARPARCSPQARC